MINSNALKFALGAYSGDSAQGNRVLYSSTKGESHCEMAGGGGSISEVERKAGNSPGKG